MNELVSVIIPAYNRGRTIRRAIQSVLAQTYSAIEVIVVDDCSTDDTKGIVNSINDSRVRYYCLKKNSGACVARNTGVDLAKGNYIAFQDSDDAWHANKLEKQMEFLLRHNYDFISCGFDRIDEKGRRALGRAICPKDKIECWCKLLNNNWISTQTIVCKTECFESVRFSPELRRFQDWDLALQASLIYRMGHLNESLVDVYRQADSITKTVKKGDSLLALVEKHRIDVDFSNPKMVSTYYKCLSDARRKLDLQNASQKYKKFHDKI